MVATLRERFEHLLKLESESLKFFSAGSYSVKSKDFKTNAAHLARVVSVLFHHIKPEIEEGIKQLEATQTREEEEIPNKFETGGSNDASHS